jgi:hypothetical protein
MKENPKPQLMSRTDDEDIDLLGEQKEVVQEQKPEEKIEQELQQNNASTNMYNGRLRPRTITAPLVDQDDEDDEMPDFNKVGTKRHAEETKKDLEPHPKRIKTEKPVIQKPIYQTLQEEMYSMNQSFASLGQTIQTQKLNQTSKNNQNPQKELQNKLSKPNPGTEQNSFPGSKNIQSKLYKKRMAPQQTVIQNASSTNQSFIRPQPQGFQNSIPGSNIMQNSTKLERGQSIAGDYQETRQLGALGQGSKVSQPTFEQKLTSFYGQINQSQPKGLQKSVSHYDYPEETGQQNCTAQMIGKEQTQQSNTNHHKTSCTKLRESIGQRSNTQDRSSQNNQAKTFTDMITEQKKDPGSPGL